MHELSRSWRIVMLTAVLCGWSASSALGQQADKQALRDVAAAYLKNYDAIGDFECLFEICMGRAASVQDAIDGKIDVEYTVGGVWKRFGDWELVIHQGNDAAIAKARKEQRPGEPLPVVLLPSSYYITSGSHDLIFLPVDKVANVYSGTPRNLGKKSSTPWHVGLMGPGGENHPAASIEKALEGSQFPMTLSSKENLAVIQHSGNGVSSAFTFDTDRGYVLREKRVEQKTGTTAAVFTDFKQLNDGWFPTRCVRYTSNADAIEALYVQEFVVTQLVAQEVLEASNFSFDLPASTLITAPQLRGTLYQLEAKMPANPDTLEFLYQQVERTAKSQDQ